ncbi:class I SAM-dependent methyltransferase [Serratia sp. NPDC078593]|uniref:class I SAM-dependent methyltransferase n=1 Tax=unclassified Serratia (in: enterobacteria) TaxID=2647522 RepID=UPI0037D95E21
MSQNIYDNQTFFDGYAQLSRSIKGLDGAPEWPTINNMLPNMSGKNVVDLGCGYGWFCRYAHEQGAASVLGLDLSQMMLNKAQEMTNDAAIVYQQQDLERLQLSKESFDLAYSSLTLHYIVNLQKMFATVFQSLRSGGKFIFTAEHPIYTAPTQQGWLVAEDGQKSWPINHYQQEGERISNWLAEGVIKQHRMLGSYINLLIQEGFVVTYLNEWGPSAQQIRENPALDEEKERPMIFILAAQKPAK